MGNENVYSIVLTTMSVLPPNETVNYYYYKEDGKCFICNGISQLEAGAKYFLSKYKIDKIIAINTLETIGNISTGKYSNGESAWSFYKKRLCAFCEGKDKEYDSKIAEKYAEELGLELHEIKVLEENKEAYENIEFIGEITEIDKKFQVDNIQGIVNAVLSAEAKACDEIHVYIDMQGGGRTSGFVRNAVMSILSNETKSKVEIKEIVAINYNPISTGLPSEIVNETKRYKIMDLAAAMNSFVRYGKSDLLLTYCQERGIKLDDNNSRLAELLRSIEAVDDAISLCNTKALSTAIQTLANVLKKPIKSQDSILNDQAFVKSVFEILKDGIKRDYGDLLEKTGDEYIIELIDWCTRKGFIQQALTLVEDKMPKVFLKSKDATNYIVKYTVIPKLGESDAAVNERVSTFAEKIGQKYYEVENNLFYRLSKNGNCEWNNCIEKNILCKAGKPFVNPVMISATEVDKSNFKVIIDSIGSGYNVTDTHVQNIKNNLVNMLTEQSVDVDEYNRRYIDKYCVFHAKQTDIENSKKDWCNPERIFDRLKSSINEEIEKSMLYLVDGTSKKYCTTQAVRIGNTITSNKITSSIEIELTLNPNYNGDRMKLDDLFRLHNALKTERNCANHASDAGIRLPAKVVKKALEIYIEEARYFVK